MATRLQVATHLADRLGDDREAALREAAAWLLEKGRRRQAGYLVRDIAQVLASRGYVYARVTTARPLGEAARETVEQFIKRETGAEQLELETVIESGVIGGVRIETPGSELDGTVQNKLTKFVQGVARGGA